MRLFQKRKRYIIQRVGTGLYASATPDLEYWSPLDKAKRFKHKSTAREVATVLEIVLRTRLIVVRED